MRPINLLDPNKHQSFLGSFTRVYPFLSRFSFKLITKNGENQHKKSDLHVDSIIAQYMSLEIGEILDPISSLQSRGRIGVIDALDDTLEVNITSRDVKSGTRLGFRSGHFRSGKIGYRSFQVDLTFRLESGRVQVRFRSGLFQFETLSLVQILDNSRRCLVGWVGIVHRWLLGHFE
ncbi:hypothetical protein GQ457_01G022270 [Hibiscus cannabinus]